MTLVSNPGNLLRVAPKQEISGCRQEAWGKKALSSSRIVCHIDGKYRKDSGDDEDVECTESDEDGCIGLLV